MNVYIALLRGINVSGHNKIKMVDLQQLFKNEGFKNVITYIQSGNVIFSSEGIDISKMGKTITNAIKKQFSYKIYVLVLKKNELEKVFNSNPFFEIDALDFKKIAVTFLENIPTKEGIARVEALATFEEKLTFTDKTIYLYCPNGFGRTKLSNNNIEAKLKTIATTRNWNTITKLIELSN